MKLRTIALSLLLALAGLAASCLDQEPLLISKQATLVHESTRTTTASEILMYTLQPMSDSLRKNLSSYPRRVGDWQVHTWNHCVEKTYRGPIKEFLDGEVNKWRGENMEVLRILKSMRQDLADGCVGPDRVAFRYKMSKAPGDTVRVGLWIHLYYLDSDRSRLVYVHNAFR